MTRTALSPASLAAFTPLLGIPIAAATLIHRFDGIPDFVQGLVTGASIGLLLGYCVLMGTIIGAQKRGGEQAKLDALDPLGGLERTGRRTDDADGDTEAGAR